MQHATDLTKTTKFKNQINKTPTKHKAPNKFYSEQKIHHLGIDAMILLITSIIIL